jgi:hypothetical protein
VEGLNDVTVMQIMRGVAASADLTGYQHLMREAPQTLSRLSVCLDQIMAAKQRVASAVQHGRDSRIAGPAVQMCMVRLHVQSFLCLVRDAFTPCPCIGLRWQCHRRY